MTINILDVIKRINGVGDATLFGPLDYSMRVWLDPSKLTNYDLAPTDIGERDQVAEHAGGGRPDRRGTGLAGPAVPAHHHTKGRLTSAEEFENIIVRANPDGSVVRVSDVARVELGRQVVRPVLDLQWQARGARSGSTWRPAPTPSQVADAVARRMLEH